MKKILILPVLLLLLCGCSIKKTNVKPVLDNTSFNVKVSYYNEKYSLKAVTDLQGGIVLEVLEPEELSEMQLIHKGEKVSINYKGLTYNANKRLPIAHTTEILYEVISDCREEELKLLEKEGNLSLEGKVGGKEYIATFSPSGILLSIKVPSIAFESVFSNVKILKTE